LTHRKDNDKEIGDKLNEDVMRGYIKFRYLYAYIPTNQNILNFNVTK